MNKVEKLYQQYIKLLLPEERLWLVELIVHDLAAQPAELKMQEVYHVPRQRRKWREVCGSAPHPLLGEDAQAWVSRTRREGDEHREKQWKGGS